MFEYTKQILMKVSFDRSLFKKELTKAIKVLGRDERMLLQAWCAATFIAHSDAVVEVFMNCSS